MELLQINENKYLSTMNKSVDKLRILNYLKGNSVVDVGSGGGMMLNAISERYPMMSVYGTDISKKFLNRLNRIKVKESRKWNIKEANAINLTNHFDKNSVDNVIFSSILHEVYSYNEINGKKFNQDSVRLALQESFKLLKKGGRIIIRDGISDDNNELSHIIFKDELGVKFFNNYVKDFKGRKINYEWSKNRKGMLSLGKNDAMEFLYTYTWGEDSYPREVKEQFGYFSLSEYVNNIEQWLGKSNINIIENRKYLLPSYTNNLKSKVTFIDSDGNTKLPDSTCFIVIEKK